MDNHQLWESVLGEVELQISRPNFITWLKQSKVVSKDDRDGVILVGLSNNFAKEWVRSRYHKLILGSLRNFDSSVKNVDYIVVNSDTEESIQKKLKRKQREISLVSMKPQESLLDLRMDPKTNLNQKYTFDSFIIGSSNELAYAALQAVIDDVGKKYNPLFIYGGVGLGKTHLMQGAGNEIVKKYQGRVKVLYVTSERFINDVVWAVRNRRMDDVKTKYRDIDVLIIDDIQFIGGKPTTEQEFFYTFNALHENNKQVIMSSDRPPAAIPTLEERLRSRFEGGMIADISYPDYEMRLAILRTKTQTRGMVVEEKTLEFIASKVQKNIRELEGVLNKVLFYQQYKNEKIDNKKLEAIINETTQAAHKNFNAQDIIKTVADFFNIAPQELTNRSRKKEVVLPRQICMYLMREMLSLSYPNIGEKLGNRDHTTAIHAYEKILREVSQNSGLNQKILAVREKIQKASE